jgi:hypothetical protein
MYAVPESHKERLHGATHACIHIAKEGVGRGAVEDFTLYPSESRKLEIALCAACVTETILKETGE